MRFRPSDVVNAVGSVERGELRDGLRGVEVEDVETAVAEDAEVLGGGDGETVLEKWTEFDGVAVKRGFEYRHVCLFSDDDFGFVLGSVMGVDRSIVIKYCYQISDYKALFGW